MLERPKDTVKQSSSVGYVVCCVLIGSVFLLLPGLIIGALSLILGILCIAYGIWKLISAWQTGAFSRIGAVFGGIAAILIGVYIICRPQKIFSLLPMAAGIFFLMDGIDRIRCAAAMHRTARTTAANKREVVEINRQKRRFYYACVIGAVTVLCGVLMLLNPFGALELTLRVCGFLILINGIGAFWTTRALRTTLRLFGNDVSHHVRTGAYETEFRDITDTDKQ